MDSTKTYARQIYAISTTQCRQPSRRVGHFLRVIVWKESRHLPKAVTKAHNVMMVDVRRERSDADNLPHSPPIEPRPPTDTFGGGRFTFSQLSTSRHTESKTRFISCVFMTDSSSLRILWYVQCPVRVICSMYIVV